MTLDFTNLARYIELRREKAELNSKLKVVNAEIDQREQTAIDEMIDMQVKSLKVQGVTLFLSRKVYVGVDRQEGEDTESAHERASAALIDAGLSQYVHQRFMTGKLAAWVRERIENKEALPEEFNGAIRVTNLPGMGTRNLGIQEEEDNE